MTIPGATPDMRIADSMEQIARYIGEIKQMLQDLSARPDVDNAQLQRNRQCCCRNPAHHPGDCCMR